MLRDEPGEASEILAKTYKLHELIANHFGRHFSE